MRNAKNIFTFLQLFYKICVVDSCMALLSIKDLFCLLGYIYRYACVRYTQLSAIATPLTIAIKLSFCHLCSRQISHQLRDLGARGKVCRCEFLLPKTDMPTVNFWTWIFTLWIFGREFSVLITVTPTVNFHSPCVNFYSQREFLV